jgi:hypothetical protein
MKVFSPVLDALSQLPNPIVEDALELIQSDAIKSVCQWLDVFVWILKTLVLYGSLGSSGSQKSHGVKSRE